VGQIVLVAVQEKVKLKVKVNQENQLHLAVDLLVVGKLFKE
jgi:hypothetical protein